MILSLAFLLRTFTTPAIIFVSIQGQQQIAVQGQQVAQTAEGQTIVYQPVNADGTILQQGNYFLFLQYI